MALEYLEVATTTAVQEAQRHYYGRAQSFPPPSGPGDEERRTPLGPDEAAFIMERDSFYLGTVGETGWPYVQHRGGPPGFLRVLDAHTLAFADLRGTANSFPLATSRPATTALPCSSWITPAARG